VSSGAQCRYTVYKLSSGAYFKYSSGGTPVLLFALGYGTEGKNDVGETYTFVMGDKEALPIAATLGMVGMRAGGVLLTWSAKTCDLGNPVSAVQSLLNVGRSTLS
jgi:hypothetical protein